MNEKSIEMIINYLQQMGVIIAENTEKVVNISYPILLKQVYVESFSYALWFLLIIPVSLLLIYGLYKCYKDYNGDMVMDGEIFSTIVTVGIFGIPILSWIFIEVAQEVFTRLINPNWYVAKMIFELINK